jgi:hypothetical protein
MASMGWFRDLFKEKRPIWYEDLTDGDWKDKRQALVFLRERENYYWDRYERSKVRIGQVTDAAYSEEDAELHLNRALHELFSEKTKRFDQPDDVVVAAATRNFMRFISDQRGSGALANKPKYAETIAVRFKGDPSTTALLPTLFSDDFWHEFARYHRMKSQWERNLSTTKAVIEVSVNDVVGRLDPFDGKDRSFSFGTPAEAYQYATKGISMPRNACLHCYSISEENDRMLLFHFGTDFMAQRSSIQFYNWRPS